MLMLFACRQEPFQEFDTRPIPAGAYRYTGHISAQSVAVRGWLLIDTSSPEHVIGTWHLDRSESSQNIGPQVGEGRLEGMVDRGLAAISLNPDTPEDYVELNGVLTAIDFSGQWTYRRGTTIVARGQFQARKD